MPWSSGAVPLGLAAGVVTRIFIASISEGVSELDRKVQQFTVQRLIGEVSGVAASDSVIMAVGIILLHRDQALVTLNPGSDPFGADWMYLNEIRVGTSISDIGNRMRFDIGTGRKAQHGANELYIYVENRAPVIDATFHAFGRALVLE